MTTLPTGRSTGASVAVATPMDATREAPMVVATRAIAVTAMGTIRREVTPRLYVLKDEDVASAPLLPVLRRRGDALDGLDEIVGQIDDARWDVGVISHVIARADTVVTVGDGQRQVVLDTTAHEQDW